MAEETLYGYMDLWKDVEEYKGTLQDFLAIENVAWYAVMVECDVDKSSEVPEKQEPDTFGASIKILSDGLTVYGVPGLEVVPGLKVVTVPKSTPEIAYIPYSSSITEYQPTHLPTRSYWFEYEFAPSSNPEPKNLKYVYRVLAGCKDKKKWVIESKEIPMQVFDGPIPVKMVAGETSVPKEHINLIYDMIKPNAFAEKSIDLFMEELEVKLKQTQDKLQKLLDKLD